MSPSESTSKWNPESYTVSEVKGTMVTATRASHRITRNLSFFKPFIWDDGRSKTDDGLEGQTQQEAHKPTLTSAEVVIPEPAQDDYSNWFLDNSGAQSSNPVSVFENIHSNFENSHTNCHIFIVYRVPS
jgi:hypothetical protein